MLLESEVHGSPLFPTLKATVTCIICSNFQETPIEFDDWIQNIGFGAEIPNLCQSLPDVF